MPGLPGYIQRDMMPISRSTAAFLLSLMLVFTGQSMAVARGMPGPHGTIVLCTGQGPVMINVDADGQPLGAPHLCPDGALSLIQAGFDVPDCWSPLQRASTRAVFDEAGHLSVGAIHGIAQARDPPHGA